METETLIAPPQRPLHSQALDLLRFPLAVIVVIAHVFPVVDLGDTFFGRPYNFENFPICSIVFNLFFAFFRNHSVPIYFFISGYVFFLGIEHFTKEAYIRKLRNRVKTLLIPYLAWNTIAVLCFLAANLPAVLRPDSHFNLHWLLSAYWIYDGNFLVAPSSSGACDPIIIPLWFLRNLMVVVLTTPVIYAAIKKFKILPLILLGCVWMSIRILHPEMLLLDRFVTAFFFFSWGATFSILKKDLMTEFGRIFKPAAILFIFLGSLCVFFAYHNPNIAQGIKPSICLLAPPIAFNTSAWLLKKGYCKVNKNLAGTGFFIYASHWTILDNLHAHISRSVSTDFGIFSAHILTLLLLLGILLFANRILVRFFPAIHKILTGGK